MTELERRSAPRPGPYRPFEVDEPADTADAGAGALASEALLTLGVARELERVAIEGVRGPAARPDPSFVERVMTAVATEPLPAPTIALRSFHGGLGARRLPALAEALGDAFRVAFGPGRPLAVRAPALALSSLLLVVVGLGAVGAVGGLSLLGGRAGEPSASLPGVGGMPSPSIEQSSLPMPSSAPAITVLPTPPSTPTAAATPDQSAKVTAKPAATPPPPSRPTSTPRPTTRATAAPTASPTETPHPTETSDGSHSTEPTGTPEPTSTPESSSGSGG